MTFCLYGLVFMLFVFTFPNPPVSSRPAFVFLGSILQRQDLENGSQERRNPAAVVHLDLGDHVNHIEQGVPKPAFVDQLGSLTKKDYKSSMRAPEPQGDGRKNFAPPDDLQLQPVSRIPLKLFPP